MAQILNLGFDGGATKTTCVALDSDLRQVVESTGPASNFQIIGTDKASENLLKLTESVLKQAGADYADIGSIYLGLTGAGRISDADRMRNTFMEHLQKRISPLPIVRIGSDALAALEGAFSGNPGMILIAGTGSILLAKDEQDRIHRVGGWGRYIGDEGSGYALGRSVLSAAARELDGRGPKTVITGLLRERHGLDDQQAIIRAVYQDNLDIASLAPVVIDAAASGDEVAMGIVRNAASELADHVQAAMTKLPSMVRIALIGSIVSTENPLSAEVRLTLQKRFPEVIINKPENSPAMGAALLAAKSKGQK